MRNTSVIYSSLTLQSTEIQSNLRVTFRSARKTKIDLWGELLSLYLEASLTTYSMFEDLLQIMDDNCIKKEEEKRHKLHLFKLSNPFSVKTEVRIFFACFSHLAQSFRNRGDVDNV